MGVLEVICEKVLVSELQQVQTFSWLPSDATLWYIQASESDLETRAGCSLMFAKDFISLEDDVVRVREGDLARDEGNCIVALFNNEDDTVVGYYADRWYDGWIPVHLDDFRTPFRQRLMNVK
jgi:hypothetical protein